MQYLNNLDALSNLPETLAINTVSLNDSDTLGWGNDITQQLTVRVSPWMTKVAVESMN